MEREEAIHIVKTTKDWSELREALAVLVPELRESEDEKIRKEIEQSAKEYYKENYAGDNPQGRNVVIQSYIDGALAYLERQKENSLSLIDAWKEMRTEVFAQASGNKPKPESDEFTKLFSLNDIDFLISDLDSRGIKPKPVEKQDYSGLNDFERAIHRGFLCAGVENVPVTIINETAKDCLANLYDEKPAWSEEDERKLNDVICIVGKSGLITPYREHYIRFLKSLRPQKLDASKLENFDPVDVLNRIKTEFPMAWEKVVWKPNEEQIGCFERLIAFKNPEPEDIKGCESLLEQLKKL